MKDVLEKVYKITSNKTLDINFEFPIHLIPETLQGHFVRGFIDGDGYIGDNGFKNNISVSIIGTSIKFITLIGNLVAKNTGMSYKIYEKISAIYRLNNKKFDFRTSIKIGVIYKNKKKKYGRFRF